MTFPLGNALVSNVKACEKFYAELFFKEGVQMGMYDDPVREALPRGTGPLDVPRHTRLQ